jgi:hypothetical protein
MTATEKAFEKMGARLKVLNTPIHMPRGRLRQGQIEPIPARLDIRRDSEGEFFEITVGSGQPEIIQVQPDRRHLLLMIRDGKEKNKYLCGHDERHWFVAAVPPDPGVTTVETAMRALKPRGLKDVGGVIRQGEWFAVPRPYFDETRGIHCHNEPISRGRGKPHICEHLIRRGGTTVYLGMGLPETGVTLAEYEKMVKADPKLAKNSHRTRTMTRGAEVFAMGAMRHPDHKTVHLDGWHQIFLNRESDAPHATKVVFLD